MGSGTDLLFLLLLILGQPEVHPQADPGAGAGVSVVCQGPCFQAGVGRGVREGHHHHGGAPILMVSRRCRLLHQFGVRVWRPRHQPCRGFTHGQRVENHRACFRLERTQVWAAGAKEVDEVAATAAAQTGRLQTRQAGGEDLWTQHAGAERVQTEGAGVQGFQA